MNGFARSMAQNEWNQPSQRLHFGGIVKIFYLSSLCQCPI